MKYTIIRDVKKPTGNRKEDVCFDFYVPNDWNNGKPKRIYLGQQVNIPTGIKVKVPQGMSLTFENKSGIALKRGLVCGAKIVDPGYRGECHINLMKVAVGTEDKRNWLGRHYTVIAPGDKVSQAALYRISTESLSYVDNKTYEQGAKTSRGAGSFGSTGTK